MTVPPHLQPVANALAAVLHARHPEHTFIITVDQDRHVPGGTMTAPSRPGNAGPVTHNPDPLVERLPPTPAVGGPHDDHVEQVA